MKKLLSILLCVVFLCACGKDTTSDVIDGGNAFPSAVSEVSEEQTPVATEEPTVEPTEEPVVTEVKDPVSEEVQATVTVDLQPLIDSLTTINTVDDLYAGIYDTLVTYGLTGVSSSLIQIDSFTAKSEDQEALVHIANSDIVMIYFDQMQKWDVSNKYGSDYCCILFDKLPNDALRTSLYDFLATEAPTDKISWLMSAEWLSGSVSVRLYDNGKMVGSVMNDRDGWKWYDK